MFAAAARVGAPLGHDFCAINLSDNLKPWDLVERRLRLAAQADFVIALYNPLVLGAAVAAWPRARAVARGNCGQRSRGIRQRGQRRQ
jgi:hypothetical protein